MNALETRRRLLLTQTQDDGNLIKLSQTTPVVNINTGYDATLVRTLEHGTVYQGTSQNNYWLGASNRRLVESVANGGITYKSNDSSYGHGICVKVKPNTTYAVSFSGENVFSRTAEYDASGAWVKGYNRKPSGNSYTFITTTTTEWVLFICVTELVDTLVTMSNVSFKEQ